MWWPVSSRTTRSRCWQRLTLLLLMLRTFWMLSINPASRWWPTPAHTSPTPTELTNRSLSHLYGICLWRRTAGSWIRDISPEMWELMDTTALHWWGERWLLCCDHTTGKSLYVESFVSLRLNSQPLWLSQNKNRAKTLPKSETWQLYSLWTGLQWWEEIQQRGWQELIFFFFFTLDLEDWHA